MNKKEQVKVRKNYRLSSSTITTIKQLQVELDVTETQALETALRHINYDGVLAEHYNSHIPAE